MKSRAHLRPSPKLQDRYKSHICNCRAKWRTSRALAEVAAVLAHEIRNPLGSMELFAGLLADATAQMPETRQRVTHLQAGLRTLSSTKQGKASCIPLSVTAFARSSPQPDEPGQHRVRVARRF
jgi:hypothetical protein